MDYNYLESKLDYLKSQILSAEELVSLNINMITAFHHLIKPLDRHYVFAGLTATGYFSKSAFDRRYLYRYCCLFDRIREFCWLHVWHGN